jgi:hypothetical protein
MILEDDTSRIVAVGERGRRRLSPRQSCVGLARYRAEQQFQVGAAEPTTPPFRRCPAIVVWMKSCLHLPWHVAGQCQHCSDHLALSQALAP